MSTQLVSLKELHYDVEKAFKHDSLHYLLNQEPHERFVVKHPTVKVKNDKGEEVAARDIPIDKIEFLLDRIFQEWKIEVLREGTMFNSVYCTVRVHYKDPLTGEWRFHDGVGAKDCQLDSGSKASDMSHIKAAAVQMALPSAKSYAIKDACDHLGKLFGRDLNRRNTIAFAGAYSDETPSETKLPSLKTNFEL